MTIQLGITSKGKAEQLFFIVDLDNNMARNVVDSKEKKKRGKNDILDDVKIVFGRYQKKQDKELWSR